jgi:DNA polymerase III epsilon subunit-like protein
LVASSKASTADAELIAMFSEQKGLTMEPGELNMIKKICYNQITPGQLKRYIALRGVDINPRSRTRKVSADEMSGFIRAGLGNIGDIEELVRMDLKPHHIVEETPDGGFRLLPKWQEWKDARSAVRFQHIGFGEGRHQQEIADTEFLIIDLETTGLDMDASIIEVAMVRMRGDGTVLEEFETLVDPGETRTFMGETKNVYDKVRSTTRVHEIDPEEIKGAPSFAEVGEKIKEMLDGAVLVAHYDKYEEGRLSYEFSRLGETLPTIPSLDTKKIAQEYYGFEKGKDAQGRKFDDSKLEHLHKTFLGEEMSDAHHAMADVKSTQEFLKIVLSDVQAGGVTTIGMSSPPPRGLRAKATSGLGARSRH